MKKNDYINSMYSKKNTRRSTRFLARRGVAVSMVVLVALSVAILFGCNDVPSCKAVPWCEVAPAPSNTIITPVVGNLKSSQSQTPNTIDVTVSVNKSGTLFWVLYEDGTTAPANAAAVITAAGMEKSMPIVSNSGDKGQAAPAAGTQTISIPSLTAGVQYDFYVAMRDADNNMSLYYSLDIALPAGPDRTAPTFGAPTLVAASVTFTSAAVTIDNISENGTLYWALYTDGNAPANADALVAAAQGAAAGDIVDNSGSSGQAVTANVDAIVSLSSLAPGTNYDFYAVIRDRASNNSLLSDKLDILTTADRTAPTFTAPALAALAETDRATVTIGGISESGTLYWALYTDGNAPADADALVTAAGETPSGNVVVNSGSSGQPVTPATDARVPLFGLLSGTAYDFYAVLQDDAGNNSALSAKLDITTQTSSDVTAPTFGAPALEGTADTTSATVTIGTISEDGTLYWALYTDGNAPADAAALVTAAQGAVGGNVVVNSGRRGQAVTANVDALVFLPGLSSGTNYDFYAVLRDGAGNSSVLSGKLDILTAADSTAPTFTFDTPAISRNTGTSAIVTINNISEDGTLYWALYTDGNSPASASALVTAAGGTASGNVVANSGSSGQAVTAAATNARVFLYSLSPSTQYDFYAVIQDRAGNNSSLSTKLDIGTAADTEPPTFNTPTLESTTDTSATVTIDTISEDGTLYWALYTDGNAPADASALVTAAQGAIGGNVVANSGSSGQTVTTTEVRIPLSGLTRGTQYDFYAVLQDEADNNSALSDKLDILTVADETAPTFNTPVANTTDTSATVTIPNISEDGTLYWALYTDGSAAPADAAALIAAAGAAAAGAVVDNSGSIGQPVTSAVDARVLLSGLTPGTDYDFYAVIQDRAGNSTLSDKIDILTASDTTGPTFTTPTLAAPADTTNATVTISNISEDGILYWALYTDGSTAPADAAALVTAAQGTVEGDIVDNSGSSGQVVRTSASIPLFGLSPGTNYNFYAVIQDITGNNSALSATLTIRTAADTTAPTFGTPVISRNTAGTSAIVTIPNISEDGTLYWALYTDGSAAPADAVALLTAAQAAVAGNVVANSGSSGQAVTVVAVNARVFLSGLTAGTAYDFYAVVQDGAGNNSARSDKLDILTPATVIVDTTAPTFDAPVISENTAGTSAEVTIRNISENGTLYWVLYTDGNAPADAAALVTAAGGTPSGNVVANSGSSGQTVTAVADAVVSLSGLTHGTAYDFYAVIQDAASNNSALSDKLDILTPPSVVVDTTPPTFATPAIANTGGTSATVTIGSISEDGTLYWALYTDGNAPASASTLVTAAQAAVAGNIVANSGSSGQMVTSTENALVSLSGLSSATAYDFYAVIRDAAGNTSALSDKLDILTSTLIVYGCPAGETYNAELGQCGMDRNMCPTGQVLVGSTCQVMATCTTTQLYSASTNTCLSREYEVELVPGTFATLNISAQGRFCNSANAGSIRNLATLRVRGESAVAREDLNRIAMALAGNYNAEIYSQLASEVVEKDGMPIRIPLTLTSDITSATAVRVRYQIRTDMFPMFTVPAGVLYQIRINTSVFVPSLDTIIPGVPGRYSGGAGNRELAPVTLMLDTSCT